MAYTRRKTSRRSTRRAPTRSRRRAPARRTRSAPRQQVVRIVLEQPGAASSVMPNPANFPTAPKRAKF